MLLPVATAFILLSGNSLNLLTEGCLTGQIVFLLGTHTLEMLLMTLVDDSRSGLKTIPDLLTLLFGNRTDLTILLMQFLQLVECADDILLVSQFLCCLTEGGLQLQILLEIIFTSLTIEAKHIIELLDIELIVTPQLTGLFGRNSFDLTPLLLERLELLIALVGLFRGGDHSLNLVDDGEFLGEVLLFLSFLLFHNLGTLLFDDAHFGFEVLLKLIRRDLILLWVATSFEIGFELCLALSNMELVEGRFQIVHLILLRCLVAMRNILHTLQYLGFGLIDLARLFFRSWHCFFIHHFRSCCFLDNFFGFLLLEDVLLRVHHLTI